MRYSVYKKTSSEEYHFHGGESYPWGCESNQTSICKKSIKTEGILVTSCLTASEARFKAASIGEAFCGTCVSHLYKNY